MNSNEKFLLKLLEKVDYVSCIHEKEILNFSIDDLNMEVKIPYSHSSDHIDINLIYSIENENGDYRKETISFNFDSFEDIKEFLVEFYKKYEHSINYSPIPSDLNEKYEGMLKLPFDENYPYFNKLTNELFIQDIDGNKKYGIDLEDAINKYGSEIKFKPLAPITVSCYYISGEKLKSYSFQKVIPAYLINDYPILNKFAKTNSSVKNLDQLQKALDSIKDLDPKTASILNAFILDSELRQDLAEKTPKFKL